MEQTLDQIFFQTLLLLPKMHHIMASYPYTCTCTARIVNNIEMTYSSGTCKTNISNATECFEAAQKVEGSKVEANLTVSTAKMPKNCSVIHHHNGLVIAYYNSQDSSMRWRSRIYWNVHC